MLYIVLRNIVYPFIRIFMRVKVTGKENIPKDKGFILCANHVSMADVFALAVPFNCHIRYMAKGELFKSKFLNWFFRALGSFSVQRGEGDIDAIAQACEILEDGGVFGIFPEGTRSMGGEIKKPKSGAAVIAMKTKADILPVSIRYSTDKFRLFCKAYVNIGKLIPYSQPEDDATQRGEIRRVTNAFMGEIINLWGKID